MICGPGARLPGLSAPHPGPGRCRHHRAGQSRPAPAGGGQWPACAEKADRIHDILRAADRADLLYWLRQQPLLARHERHGFVMTHAGIPPQWTVTEAEDAARAAEAELRSAHYRDRLRDMYGNQPDGWRDDLGDLERLRFTINALTRMRLCAWRWPAGLRLQGKPYRRPDGASSLV
ncbi:hypothetical protein MBH78_11435 [Oceanimonas sp. NS1]|nr:hypothetical protein [Oceanimonas sp. NS1]